MVEDAIVNDPRPQWLIDVQLEATQPISIEVDGNSYTYTLVKPGLTPRLPYVVGIPSLEAPFISADVPERYRAHIVGHEIRHETLFHNMPPEQACVAALQAELIDVLQNMPDEFEPYVAGTMENKGFAGRREFFKALVELYKDPKEAAARTPEFIEGIKNAQEYLEHLDLQR